MMNSVSDICFTNYDAVNSVMHVGNRKHYLIKNEKRWSLEKKLMILNDAEKANLSHAIVTFYVNKSVGKKKGVQNYQFRTTILARDRVKFLTSVFSFLFNDFVIWEVWALALFVSLYFLVFRSPLFVHEYFEIDYNWLLIIAMCFFHEIGHASACKYYNAPVGEIGFGIASFRPVMFTNVTGAWYLNKKQRIIVNVGGVYFQTIFVAVITLISLQIHNASLYYVSKTMMLSVFFLFCPFYRMDGYWLLSDIIGEPNLYENSFVLLQKDRKIGKLSGKQKILLLYFILTETIVLASLLRFIISNWDLIVSIPGKLRTIFISTINGDISALKVIDCYSVWVCVILFLMIKSVLKLK